MHWFLCLECGEEVAVWTPGSAVAEGCPCTVRLFTKNIC